MLVPFNSDDDVDFYRNYFDQQVGNGITVYKGSPMIGYGVGSFFSGVARRLLPIVKTKAIKLAKHGLSAGVNMGTDILNGSDVKSSARKRLRDEGLGILDELNNVLTTPRPSHTSAKKRRVVVSNSKKKRKPGKPAKTTRSIFD